MRFLRIDELLGSVGVSRSTIWRLERAGEFPRRRHLTAGTVGWVEDEVLEWQRQRAADTSTVLAERRAK